MSSFESNEYLAAEHALAYLAKQDKFPHRTEGEAVLMELLPKMTKRILDLGTGDGRLLHIAMLAFPRANGIGIDFSPTMLSHAKERFGNDQRISLIDHNLSYPLSIDGEFDAIISSFAIHHLLDERKRRLFQEIFEKLSPGGVFCNLEHVTSPTRTLHKEFYEALGSSIEQEDPSNRCVDVQTQLQWLREAGLEDVDCCWKWREFALLAGRKADLAGESGKKNAV